jgi:hypothetical protein
LLGAVDDLLRPSSRIGFRNFFLRGFFHN